MSNQRIGPLQTTLFVKDTCICLYAQRAAGAQARRLDKALKPLERNGLIMVVTDGKDRRQRLQKITDTGLERLAAALPVWQAEHTALDKEMPQGELSRLRQGLLQLS